MTFYKTFSGFGVGLKIHKDHIGYICGSKFKTISEIGRSSHTRIQVGDDDFGDMKCVTIGGRSIKDVRCAYEKIMCVARVAEERMARVSEMGSLNDCMIGGMIGVECHLEIAGEDVGMVLGRKGSTLRKIGCDTWTWIKLFPGSVPKFSVRGFLRSDVDEGIKRISSIAQESYNRRSGGPPHNRVPRAHEPMNLGEKVGEFNMAPVPVGKRRNSPAELKKGD
jgi:hypothetical protein